jgi:ArsR family transcriptional regulator
VDDITYHVYFLHAQILRVLGQPRRLMILDHLHSGEKSVGELVELLGLPQANVSQHLAALRGQDIVTTRRDGNTIYYSLVDPRIVQACDLFHEFLADRMRDNRSLARSFPSARPLRATSPESASEGVDSPAPAGSPENVSRSSG